MATILLDWVERTQSYDAFTTDIDWNIYFTREFLVSTHERLGMGAAIQDVQNPTTGLNLPGIGDQVTVSGAPVWLSGYRFQSQQLTTAVFCDYTNNPRILASIRAEGQPLVTAQTSEQVQVMSERIPIGARFVSPSIPPGPRATSSWVESDYPAQRTRAALFLETMVHNEWLAFARGSSTDQAGNLHLRNGLLMRYLGHEGERVSNYYTSFRYMWEVDYGIPDIQRPLPTITAQEFAVPDKQEWITAYSNLAPLPDMVCPPYYRLKYLPKIDEDGVPDFEQRPEFTIVPEPFLWNTPNNLGGQGWESLYGAQ